MIKSIFFYHLEKFTFTLVQLIIISIGLSACCGLYIDIKSPSSKHTRHILLISNTVIDSIIDELKMN